MMDADDFRLAVVDLKDVPVVVDISFAAYSDKLASVIFEGHARTPQQCSQIVFAQFFSVFGMADGDRAVRMKRNVFGFSLLEGPAPEAPKLENIRIDLFIAGSCVLHVKEVDSNGSIVAGGHSSVCGRHIRGHGPVVIQELLRAEMPHVQTADIFAVPMGALRHQPIVFLVKGYAAFLLRNTERIVIPAVIAYIGDFRKHEVEGHPMALILEGLIKTQRGEQGVLSHGEFLLVSVAPSFASGEHVNRGIICRCFAQLFYPLVGKAVIDGLGKAVIGAEKILVLAGDEERIAHRGKSFGAGGRPGFQ